MVYIYQLCSDATAVGQLVLTDLAGSERLVRASTAGSSRIFPQPDRVCVFNLHSSLPFVLLSPDVLRLAAS